MRHRVKITRDILGSDDGVTVRTYKAGEVCELGDVLWYNFLLCGAAVDDEPAAAPTYETQAIEPEEAPAVAPAPLRGRRRRS